MNRIIAYLIIFITIFSFSCKKINPINRNISSSLQNKILFTAKQAGVTNIVKLNTKIKTKQILSTSPFKLGQPILSPDKKKVVFQTRRGSADSNIWDVYIMNLDGTELINLTKKLKLTLGEFQHLDYYFTPNQQQLFIKISISDPKKDTKVFYLANLDGSEIKTIVPDNFLNKLLYDILTDTFVFLDQDHILVKNRNVLASFNWSTQTIVPIITFSEPIDDYSLSPKKQYILFKVSKEKSDDVYLYNIQQKKTTKLTPTFRKDEIASIDIRYLLWLPDGKRFVYDISTRMSEDSKINYKIKSTLYLFDTSSLQSTFLIDNYSYSVGDIIGNKIILRQSRGEAGGDDAFIFDLETNQLEKIPTPDESYGITYIYVNGENLIVFAQISFFIFNIKTKKITNSYISYNYDSNQVYGDRNTIAPDQSQFYLVTKGKLILFDNTGKQMLEETFIPFFDDRSDNIIESSFQLGSFVSPDEIVYLEFGNNKTDLLQYDLTTKKSINLTQELGNVKIFQPPPDQKKVAVMTIDAMETMYSVDIIDFKKQGKPKRISSFPVPKRYTDNFNPLADKTLLYSLGWSKDSKTLYFISAVPPEEEEENVFGNLAIYRVNADGSSLKPLTDLRFSMYQANLSPNGKQMVYVYELEQELTIAKLDKAGIKKLNSYKVLSYCFRPIWSPNGKMITVYQTNSSQNGCQFLILDEKKEILKGVPVFTSNFFEMIKLSKTENFFSADSNYVAYIKNYKTEPFQSTSGLIKNLKEEIPLKGNNVDFRWSPIDNQLLLLESKEKDQINQLTLYDCNAKTYTPVSQDVQQIFDATWSPDGKQILYAGTDSKTGQIVFKTSQVDGSSQKLLFTFGENPLESPNSIEKIEKLVWLK